MNLKQNLSIAGIAGLMLAGAGGAAEAQYYYGPPARQGYHYYQPQPQYVPPRVLRKQREMEERVRRKYGYTQQPYGYVQPYRQPRPYYGPPVYQAPSGYWQPRPGNHYYTW